MLQALVNLMKHTVDNHGKHPCTELRYVTILELLLSYQMDKWEPSFDVNSQWKTLECKAEPGIDPEEFRRQAYQVLVSLPYVPPSCALFSACSYEESEALASWNTLPLCIQARLEQLPEPLIRSDQVYHILHKIRGCEYFVVAVSSCSPEESVETNSLCVRGEGIGKTTLATLLAAHPTINDNHSTFWVDLEEEERWASCATKGWELSAISYPKYIRCLQRLCLQLGAAQNWTNFILRLESPQVRALREKEHMILAKKCITDLFKRVEGKVLIVLDGVQDETDFEWFQFIEEQ
jgi:hypothetical protein